MLGEYQLSHSLNISLNNLLKVLISIYSTFMKEGPRKDDNFISLTSLHNLSEISIMFWLINIALTRNIWIYFKYVII